MDKNLQRLMSVAMWPSKKALAIPVLALKSVTSKDGKNVYASSDTLFKDAVFGRDSLEVADDLMLIKPKLVHTILFSMAELQGCRYDEKNEEEPGRIIHEYRRTRVGGKPISKTSLAIFTELSRKWGGDENTLAYYGSVDSTPHFLKTLGAYTSFYGDSILSRTVRQRDGQVITILDAAYNATKWLRQRLETSKSGLLEYRRVNPRGIENQVWKDSDEFYVHENGQFANHNAPIASIEVQGIAFDGMLAAAKFFPHRTKEYQKIADELRERTIKLLWQPRRNYFALGVDYSDSGKLRVMKTPTANPAALLDSHFFDDLKPALRQKYLSAIVTKIMSKDFLTHAGIRSRSLAAADLVEFWDYHGSYVSWPKETYDIAKGLKRQGFVKLGHQLENRLLNIILKTREYPEFVYVDDFGRVLASGPSNRPHGELILVTGSNKPERIQAWTLSAIIAILAIRLGPKTANQAHGKPDEWQIKLEKDILQKIPNVKRYINPLKLISNYPSYKYRLSNAKKLE